MYLLYILFFICFGLTQFQFLHIRRYRMYSMLHVLLLCIIPFVEWPIKNLILLFVLSGLMHLRPKFKIKGRIWCFYEYLALCIVIANSHHIPYFKLSALHVLNFFTSPHALLYVSHYTLSSVLLYQVFSRFNLWFRVLNQYKFFLIIGMLFICSFVWIYSSDFQNTVFVALCLILYTASVVFKSPFFKNQFYLFLGIAWVLIGALSEINWYNQNQKHRIANAVRVWEKHQNFYMDKTFDDWVNKITNDSTLVNLITLLPQSDASLHSRIRSHLELNRDVPFVYYAILSNDQNIVLKAVHPWLNKTQNQIQQYLKSTHNVPGKKNFYYAAHDSSFYYCEFALNATYKFRLFYNPEQFNSLNYLSTALQTNDSTNNLLFNSDFITSAYFNTSGLLIGTENTLPQAYKTAYTGKLQSGSKRVFYLLHYNFEHVFFLILSQILSALVLFFLLKGLYRGKALYNSIKASMWHQNVWAGTVVITLISAVLLFLVYFQFKVSLESIQNRKGLQLSNSIAQEFKAEFTQVSAFDKVQKPLWIQLCNDLQMRYNTPIMLYDSTGKRIHLQTTTTYVIDSIFPNTLSPELLLSAHNSQGFVIKTLHYPVYVCNSHFLKDNADIFIATIQVNDYNYQNQVKAQLGNRCIHVFIVTVLLCVMLSSLINYQLSKPLRQLRKQLHALSVEHTNAKIQIRGSGDLAQLISAYNILIDRLQNNIEVLKLNEQSKAWKALALQVAHDIRNPLTPLKLNLQYLIQLQERDTDTFTRYFKERAQLLVQQLDHVNAMVQRFSDFSNAEPLPLQQIPLVHGISTALAIIPNHVKVNWSERLELPVLAEPQSVLRVLNNLIHNAIDAMDNIQDPELKIRMYLTPQNQLAIELIDNGKGIPDEQLQHLFKFKFSSKTSGSGLGLMVSKELMTSMQGDLEYFKPETKGSGFRLLFKV